MAAGYGMRSHLLWQVQNSYGTSLTTSVYAIPFISESLTHTIEPMAEQGMYARLGERPYHEGAHMVRGDISMEAHPNAMGWLLRSVIGACLTTSAGGTQTHVMIPVASDFDDRSAVRPITAEVFRDVGSAFLLYDLVGNSLNVEIANSQLLKITANMIGAGFSRKAAGTPTFTTERPFIWDQVSAQYNGGVVGDLRNLTLTVNNNLEAQYTLAGSKAPYRIKRTGPTMIEASGVITFAAHSYQQAFEAQSELPFVIHVAGQVAPNAITFDMPAFRFKTFDVHAAGPGIMEANFTGGAMFSTTSNAALRITLVNTQPTYIAVIA